MPASNAGTWQAEACELPGLLGQSLSYYKPGSASILLGYPRQVRVKRAGKIRLNMANREDKQRAPGAPKSTLRICMRLGFKSEARGVYNNDLWAGCGPLTPGPLISAPVSLEGRLRVARTVWNLSKRRVPLAGTRL